MELYRGAPKRDDDLQEEGNVLEFDFDELAEEAPKKKFLGMAKYNSKKTFSP